MPPSDHIQPINNGFIGENPPIFSINLLPTNKYKLMINAIVASAWLQSVLDMSMNHVIALIYTEVFHVKYCVHTLSTKQLMEGKLYYCNICFSDRPAFNQQQCVYHSWMLMVI